MTATYIITTTTPYVNARPHIGHALELVQADVLSRYRRGRGDDVRFQAGTDDNSLKNVLAAETAGVAVREFVDRNAEVFAALGGALSPDHVVQVLGHLPGQEKQAAAAHGHRERQARCWQLVTGNGVTCHGR